jgi:hypothetical protein
MGNPSECKTIWVFNGVKAGFPSGLFTRRELAEAWITKNKLTGTLTLYPTDIGVYEWAIQSGMFTPSKDNQSTPLFIGKFSSAAQEHYHYENGELG